MVNSLIETLFLHRLSKEGLLKNTEISKGGHIELIPRQFYAGGNYLLKPAGKSFVVSAANLIETAVTFNEMAINFPATAGNPV
jgi:hypothetical protein